MDAKQMRARNAVHTDEFVRICVLNVHAISPVGGRYRRHRCRMCDGQNWLRAARCLRIVNLRVAHLSCSE